MAVSGEWRRKARRIACAAAFLLFAIIFGEGCGVQEKNQIEVAENGWKLVWHDEFDGKEIDPDKWVHVVGGWGFGNNELQFYTNDPKNAYVENGKLVIRALEERVGKNPYTSAKLTTQGKAAWTYGRFEIRAKMPVGKGMWPAIWMMPSDMEKYGGWPSCGEIDIMEYLGHDTDKVYGTLHMGNPHYYKGGHIVLKEGTFADDFHVFALEWTPTEMRWYMDGEMYYRTDSWFTRSSGDADNEPFPAPFNRDFYLQLNLAVGGNWPGYPDETTVFPQTFEIDYVRVYQPEDGNYESPTSQG
jgi:beta-glucanase (GH16 family)